jgi:sugar lactone lactonase YvrE
MFLDLTLLSSGFKGDVAAYSGGQVFVMDSLGKRIVSVNVSTKKSKVVAGPNIINSAESMACYEDRVFVLGSDGIYEVSSSNRKVITKSWSGDALITAFAGNLYVLDKSGNSIYRYSGLNTAFGEKQNWLAAGTSVNFANVSQISVDGSIYALFPNSKILRFSQGSPLNFNITGVIPQIGNIDSINSSPDNQNIYLLDKAGKRVVVVDKKGVYKAQYVNDLISAASKVIVSEKDNKIILLTGEKLYSIDIK